MELPLVLRSRIKTPRLRRMKPAVAVGSVLADHEWPGRIASVLVVYKRSEFAHLAAVPALVNVPTDHIGHIGESRGVVNLTAVQRHRRNARRVFAMRDRI